MPFTEKRTLIKQPHRKSLTPSLSKGTASHNPSKGTASPNPSKGGEM